ncbi:uncharacterized protein LOC126686712 [Mercurialis annua]|uniref:uncharacterized protein LOC126686712 n=1 Tax=Mercurialis annua TaxID=3986 RepID=UPI00215F07E6|nr:uncharacterized protein LOC126686712 [Mercurialis annua]
MAEDPEKKFQSIMAKLFSSPNSVSNHPSSSKGGGELSPSSRGKKRPNPETALALVEPINRRDVLSVAQSGRRHSTDTPLCRPWDRGDLMRRVATFKSMTWFAKPKAVSAVNCARRGWINLDTDIIGCEACGARLLFSTPSSWAQQQVEKAALVFSLKLDNGHKLHCPWIDNACDERLAEFPPTPPPVLVDKFKERFSAILQLLALPVISSSAVEYMRSAQLEEFLRQPPTLDFGNGSTQITQVEPLANELEVDSANLYYQAQKLISLCGWEPRSLPYVVDCKDGQKQGIKDVDILDSTNIIPVGQNTSISFCSSTANESVEATDNCHALSELQADPQSTVFDCKLCGAIVGLWAYSIVPRPTELFRLVGCTEENSKHNDGEGLGNENKVDDGGAVVTSASNSSLSTIDRPSSLNLTIAGGPPPTKQNFKATISLPLIGRNLRARLYHDSDFRDQTSNDQEPLSGCHNKNQSEEKGIAEDSFVEQVCQPEAVGVSTCKTPSQEQYSYANGEQSSYLCLESDEKGSAKESEIYISLEGMDFVIEGNISEIGMQNSSIESPTKSSPDLAQGFGQSNIFPDNLQSGGFLDSPIGSFGCSQLRMSSVSDPGASVSTENGNNKHNSLVLVTSENCDQQQVPAVNSTCGKDITQKIDARNGETPNNQNTSITQANSQEGIKDRVQNPANSEVTAYGKDIKQLSEKAMEFDPIRQHRHFCPWILSTNSGAAGWQQTLSALFRQKEDTTPTKSSPSTSKLKVDDPIASVRKLFQSPSSSKRLKSTPGSI